MFLRVVPRERVSCIPAVRKTKRVAEVRWLPDRNFNRRWVVTITGII